MRILVYLTILFCMGSCNAFSDEVDEQTLKRIKRVIGGEDVSKGDWPWLVYVHGTIPKHKFFGYSLTKVELECTGSLVGTNWVLTAAHCPNSHADGVSRADMLTPRYWHAKIGEIKSTNSWKEKVMNTINNVVDDLVFKSHYIHASKIIIHPQYNASEPTINDLALLKLEHAVIATYSTIKDEENDNEENNDDDNDGISPEDDDDDDGGIFSTLVGITKSIKSTAVDSYTYVKNQLASGVSSADSDISLIRLENQSDTFMQDPNVKCVAMGWGCMKKGGSGSLVAQEKELSVVPMDVCRRYWPNLHERYLCAGGLDDGNGVCPGDSGGPLVCKNGNEWVQVGVASFAHKTYYSLPSVYTRLPNYFEWVMDVMEKE